MSNPDPAARYSVTLVRVAEVGPATYSLEVAAGLAGVHPDRLRYYCQLGLFGEARAHPGTELIFDDDALYELRRFEHYRRQHGVNRKTLRLICGLWREVERLQAEVRFLRERQDPIR
jgi:DNA-binding transcriptional MerR regulator